MRVLLFSFALATLAAAPAFADGPKPLSITRITPSGDNAEASRQLVIEFNRAVVPLGRMERRPDEIPVTFTPQVECGWRWLNPSTLACQLTDDTALKPATRYRMQIGTGITAEDGGQISHARAHRFITSRPDVRHQWHTAWLSPTMPELRVVFTQPVSRRSAEKALFFATAVEKKIAVRVTADANDTNKPVAMKGDEARIQWLVRPVSELPEASNVTLNLATGLVTPLGNETNLQGRVLVAFDTYPAFALQSLTCSSLDKESITLLAGEAAMASRKCDPLQPVNLAFTSPVSRAEVARSVEIRSRKTGKTLPASVWGDIFEQSWDSGYPTNPHQAGRLYHVSLPALQAASDYTVTVHPAPQGIWSRFTYALARLFGAHSKRGITDRFGRGLHENASLTFSNDHRAPHFEIVHHEAVIEQNTDSEIPFYVNNLTKATMDFTKLTSAGRSEKQSHSITPPYVQDKQFAVPLGLRAMLSGGSGAVYGRVSTEPVVSKYDSEHTIFAQVTPYNVHAKIGHFESIVWVTDFATGKPVAGADVALQEITLATLLSHRQLAHAVTDANGVARLPGYAAVDPHETLLGEWRDSNPRLAVAVTKADAMALLPMSYDFEVDIWRASNETIYASTSNRHSHMRAWGTTAQGVYRVGQSIEYKLFVRDETGRSLASPKQARFDLSIIDPAGNTVHEEKNIRLSRFGSYAGSYPLASHALMGWYRFNLTIAHADMAFTRNGKKEQPSISFEPMRVLVSDFTPAAFTISGELKGSRFFAGGKAGFSTAAALYSGGAYTDANARITAQLTPQRFTSKRFEGFTFGTGDNEESRTVLQQHAPLDTNGEYSGTIELPADAMLYGSLVLESAVADDRGKFIASETRAPFFGRDRYVGIKSTEWIYNSGKEASILFGVTGIDGEPVAQTDVSVRFEKEDVRASRVKSAGSTYNSQFITRWNKVAACKGVSAKEPQPCSFTPRSSGFYRAVASIHDSKGRLHESTSYLWVTGSDYVLWKDDANIMLPLVPEKDTYEVGDKARYLIRNPYPGATALISIERYGVIDHFVQVLEGSTPTIEFEVKPDYLPGFYLSVVVVSPRVDKPLKLGEVDLGKPAYRMGYLQVPVTDAYKEIIVTPKVAKEEYRPRDEVDVTLHAAPKKPGAEGQPIEITAIVLDDAVFDLIAQGRSYFDPYKGLFALGGLDLKNYGLITRLVGRQKFEKKGANPGGDGGVDLSLRNLFKFVAYWNPSLPVDSKGNASFRFTVPDNLTRWRVLAIAATPNDRFGLGDTVFRVNRPTEIRPVMPNQLREGDAFTASFSVMNRTDAERRLDVQIEAKGPLSLAGKGSATLSERITVAPYERKLVSLALPLTEQLQDDDAAITFTARASDAQDGDAIEHRIPVKRALPLVTAASMGSTEDDPVITSLAIPSAIRSHAGDVRVVLSPSVIGNVEGAFRYMRDYPYSCWEQRLTKALAASQFTALKPYLAASFTWQDAGKVAQQVLNDAASYQAPNGGMGYFRGEDAYADPYLSAYTAFGFNQLRNSGYDIPGDVEAKLHAYLVRLLKKDAVLDWYDSGMHSDVRAVALAALAPHGDVSASDIARFAPHMPRMSLFGKAHFLRAALELDGGSDAVKATLDAILAKGNESAGTFRFNETLDDGYTRILATPQRDNCAVLSSLVAYMAAPAHDSSIDDIPYKLVRSITQSRGQRDHWENTQENIFCMQSLVDMARVYERTAPDMTVTTSLGGQAFGDAVRFTALSDAPRENVRPLVRGDAGSTLTAEVTKQGKGRLYALTRLTYSPTDGSGDGQNAGISMVREYSVERDGAWVLLKDPMHIKRGEVVRVDLYVSLPSARSFVVVDDPVPGGLEPINRDLATSSRIDAEKGDFTAAGGAWWFRFGDWRSYGASRWSFYHRELGHAAVRYYSDYLPAGNYHLFYSAQAIADGTFHTPPARAEAMYDPDIFGSSKTFELTVGEAAK